MDKTNRREFLKRTIKATAASLASGGAVWYFVGRGKRAARAAALSKPDYRKPLGGREYQRTLAISRGAAPRENLEGALDAIGGLKTLIAPGEAVLIKPNVGWDRAPEMAANTNPELVGALVTLCFKAGAKEVIVADNSCNKVERCFLRSGIGNAAAEAGARVLMPGKRDYCEADLGGEFVGVWPVLKVLYEVDRVINVPVLKHHSSSGLTIGMKNWFGVIGGFRGRLHQKMDQSIVDLAAYVKPTLTVLDAHRVLTGNGPTGGNLRDVKEMKTLAVSTDEVAVDAFGAELMGSPAERIGYIPLAEKRGLGRADYRSILRS